MADQVEMSAYIEVGDYDAFEECHAYYPEMMAEMIDRFEAHRASDSITDGQPTRTLEFGAGTGLFTRRLAARPAVACTAVEIDEVCHARLRRNLADVPAVTPLLHDSRTFGEADEAGGFDYVFSSFADHHIHPDDKGRYLASVRHNLSAGGRFIVGDEFLPEHDPASSEARAEALRTYHGHIIDVAHTRSETAAAAGDSAAAHAHLQLATLEAAALESGLAGRGDFKLSRTQYEHILAANGFAFTAHKIGPSDRDDLGGVYVYQSWPQT